MEPSNHCSPTMLKIRNRKPRKMLTLTRPLTEAIKACIYLRRLGTVLSPFNGLRMRKVLKALKLSY